MLFTFPPASTQPALTPEIAHFFIMNSLHQTQTVGSLFLLQKIVSVLPENMWRKSFPNTFLSPCPLVNTDCLDTRYSLEIKIRLVLISSKLRFNWRNLSKFLKKYNKMAPKYELLLRNITFGPKMDTTK